MSAATLTPPRKRFTRDEVEQMLGAGLFTGQRFELIGGDLIDKMSQNPPHTQATTRIAAWLTRIFDERVRTQQPIEVAGRDRQLSWPEPDLAVLAAEATDAFGSRHPRGDELLLVVEVADSSSRHDLTTKRGIYARAGVPEYWVLDILGRKLIVHRNRSQGKYEEIFALGETESASLASLPGSSLEIARLLP